MSVAGQSWSLVIFCYNESGSIARVITDALAAGQHLAQQQPYEVLVVDDGSQDGSGPIMDALAQQNSLIRIVRHPKNRGIGPALVSGYKNAQYENVCAIPADGQFEIKELYPFATFGSNEVIAFYRPEKTGYELYRQVLTWLNSFLNKLLLGLTMKDVNWVKAFKREQVQSLPLSLKSSLLESEICAKLKHQKRVFKEYPSEYLRRESGEPKGGSLKTLAAAAKEFLRLIYSVNKYRLNN
jgi:glycosyltransferase involved in cell wall biosynthesis